MLKAIQKVELALVRVETWLLVATVLVMLLLATYNVLYRNILVPWQADLATSGPPVATAPGVGDAPPAGAEAAPAAGDEAAEGAGGFGGGFGDAAGDGPADDGFGGGFGGAQPDEADGSDEGFGGGFGAEVEDDADDEPAAAQGEGADGGFGGGFGAEADDAPGEEGFGGGFGAQAEGDEGFGGGFGDGPDEPAEEAGAAAEPAPADDGPAAIEPTGGPPPDGSFAAWVVDAVNAMKLDWIDILIRQLVLISGFLGAMLATRRRKHITIDAVGKLLKGRPAHVVDTITSALATFVCAVLAFAGWDLVAIGLEYPGELMPWAEEWTFQLAFPIGFGLLAFHFAIRTIESVVHAIHDDPKHDPHGRADAVATPRPARSEAGGER